MTRIQRIEKRIKLLEKAADIEYSKVQYKSRRLRTQSSVARRVGLYQDWCTEARNIVQYLKGDITAKEFENFGHNDSLSALFKSLD